MGSIANFPPVILIYTSPGENEVLFTSFSFNLSANQKDQIITQLNNLNSLEFTFKQLINNKLEKGSCLLEFPGKLKCNYFELKLMLI